MSAYLDTSVLAAYYLPEASSERVQAAFGRLTGPLISVLVEIEFASVVARKTRAGELARDAARSALSLFHQHVDEGPYRMASVTDAHYAIARRWIEALDAPLRTFDALHLAVAHGHSVPVLTADRQFARAARKLGVRARLVS